MSRKRYFKKITASALAAALFVSAAAPLIEPDAGIFGITARAASQGSVNTDRLNVRSGPGTSYDKVATLMANTAVTINGEVSGSDGYTWYQISWNGGSGYARYDYIKTDVVYGVQDSAFEEYLNAQGFPESYKNGLRGLHEKYPNWIFEAQHTGLDWNTAVAEESKIGRNLVANTSISSWKSTIPGAFDWANNYWPGFDGATWVQASQELIAHYMDPRNFLTDPYIFQFEIQTYDPSTQTRDGLVSLVNGTFLAGDAVVPVEGSVIEGGTIIEGSTYVKGQAASGGNASSESQAGPSSGGSSGTVSIGPGAGTSSNVIIGVGVTPGSSDSGSNVSESGPYKVIGALDDLTGVITSHAGEWIHQGDAGSYTWYYVDDNGNNYANGWYWIDGNNDGISECYYFYADGTMAANTVVEGYRVDADGKWIDDAGVIQTKQSGAGTSQGGQLKKVPYVDIIMKATSESGVSPYVLASTILQEQGSGTSDLISGNDSTYPGYYNFFNTNAYVHDGMTAVQAGLQYAAEKGWDSIEKSIIGGAVNYGTNYVNRGQDTYYLKKFNVQGTNLYNHQYMTHVLAAASEGAKVSNAYGTQFKNSALRFKIPVYNNMPDTASPLPSKDGNPNNKLSALTVEGYTITPTFNMDTAEYSLIVDGSAATVNINASVIDSNARVSGAGTVSLNTGLNTIVITVTAENGDVREYKLNITRREGGTVQNDTQPQAPSMGTGTAQDGALGPGPTVIGPGAAGTTVSGETGSVTTIIDGTSDGSQGTVVIGQSPQ